MMNEYLALVAAGIVLAVPTSSVANNGPWAAGPPTHFQNTIASANGSGCESFGGDGSWRCRYFGVTEYRSPTGQYLETRAWLYVTVQRPFLHRWRYLDCPVGRNALRVTPSQAHVQTVIDADSAFCSNYGEIVTYDPWNVQFWRWGGPYSLEADLLNPRYQDRNNTSHSWTDNELGTSWREHCQGGAGNEVTVGGFRVLGNTVDFNHSFGQPDSMGSFWYQKCGTTGN